VLIDAAGAHGIDPQQQRSANKNTSHTHGLTFSNLDLQQRDQDLTFSKAQRQDQSRSATFVRTN
jgi:hypothetical protein